MEAKPELSNARVYSFGAYRLLYDIQCVDEAKQVWRGRPVFEPQMTKLPGFNQKAFDASWIFFSRRYDSKNDWDRLYCEIEMGAEWIGQPFVLVPKEKLLFAYEPAPTGGIVLPPINIVPFGGRRN